MFVVLYKKPGLPVRYFHPEKGLQKTVKTAWAFPDSSRNIAISKGLTVKTVPASPVADAMYPNGVQYNQIQW